MTREFIKMPQMAVLLKSHRIKKEITIETVSRLSGVSEDDIFYFEENKQHVKLTTFKLEKILRILDLDPLEFHYGNIIEKQNNDKNHKNKLLNFKWKENDLGQYTKTIIFGFLEFEFKIYENYSPTTITKSWFYEYWLELVDSKNSKDRFICSLDEKNPITIEQILKLADGIILNTLKELCEKLENNSAVPKNSDNPNPTR